MKRQALYPILALCTLLSSCDMIPSVPRDDDCRRQAENRIELYNKPDTYPITEPERKNALDALFNECMREHDYQEHVDTRNALPPGTVTPSPVISEEDNAYQPPVNVTVTTTQTTTEQQPVPSTPASKGELENILTNSN